MGVIFHVHMHLYLKYVSYALSLVIRDHIMQSSVGQYTLYGIDVVM